MVETVLTEYSHHTPVLHLTVLHNEVEEQLTHSRGIADVAETVLLYHLGYGEHGAGIEPTRYIVERCVPVQCLGRDIEDGFLKLLEIMDAAYLLACLRIAHHKIPETELVDDSLAEVHRKFLGVLVDKRATHLPDIIGILWLRAFDNERKIRIAPTQLPCQTYAGFRVLGTLALERYVTYHTEYVFGVSFIELQSLFIITCKHHFGTPAHTEHALMLVKSLGGEQT